MVAAVQFPPVRISATPGPALAHYWQVHYKYYTFCVWSIQPIGLQVHQRLILGEQLTDYSYVKKLSICVFWWQLVLFYPPTACLPRAGQHLSVIGESLGLQSTVLLFILEKNLVLMKWRHTGGSCSFTDTNIFISIMFDDMNSCGCCSQIAAGHNICQAWTSNGPLLASPLH